MGSEGTPFVQSLYDSGACYSQLRFLRPASKQIIMARQVKIEPFVYLFWVLLLLGWILMLSGNAALQQVWLSSTLTPISNQININLYVYIKSIHACFTTDIYEWLLSVCRIAVVEARMLWPWLEPLVTLGRYLATSFLATLGKLCLALRNVTEFMSVAQLNSFFNFQFVSARQVDHLVRLLLDRSHPNPHCCWIVE